VVKHVSSGLIHRIKLQKNPTQGGEVKEGVHQAWELAWCRD
jgi:hypothetical protein